MNAALTELQDCRRIAIMGGTFDPIHYGHLVTAETVRHAFQPDRVLFIPSGQPPHKNPSLVTSPEHRYLMTALAIADNPYFFLSRMEIEREGPAYTVDTLLSLRGQCRPDAEILFITGADELMQLLTWKDAVKIFSLCRIIAVTRPGYNQKEAEAQAATLHTEYGAQIALLNVPALDISSTDIRYRVEEGNSISYLLPPAVEGYILKNGLYRKTGCTSSLNASPFLPKQLTFDKMQEKLENRLSRKRFAHSLGVVEAAVHLAEIHQGEVEKARIAALLHDCAKEYPAEEKRAMCRRFGIPLDDVLDKQIDLTHSLLSAELAEREYGVRDPEILRAIRYHTTGRKGMGLLDKIILVADYIEPTRTSYPGLDEIRTAAETDLDKAAILGLRYVIAFNKKKGRMLHPWSTETLRDLKKQRNQK